jgi:hypothetical protein
MAELSRVVEQNAPLEAEGAHPSEMEVWSFVPSMAGAASKRSRGGELWMRKHHVSLTTFSGAGEPTIGILCK